MIQAIIKNGKVRPEEVPLPSVEDGEVLIQVFYSAISTGTEITSLKGSDVNIFKKALNEPEKIIKYINKIKSVGYNKVLQEIKQVKHFGSPTGYSISGEVVSIGKGVTNFAIGDKVAAGGGSAYHAEFVTVPENLVVKVPKNADLAMCSTVAIGSIALHAVRRVSLQLGEIAVVYGVGLIGILTVQFLKLSGAVVIAVDIDDNRLSLAHSAGADYIVNAKFEDPIFYVNNITGSKGCDAVLFTASTDSSEPLSKALRMIRRKGKFILVGTSGMNINREDIYTKEIDFLISTSYGPGRYDKDYEEKGFTYPYAYVRWTENRNMEEYCRLIGKEMISLSCMNYKMFNITNVEEAYSFLESSNPKPLLVILDYNNKLQETKYINLRPFTKLSSSIVNVAVIGTGAFALGMHLPNLNSLKYKFRIYSIMSRSGHNAKNVAEMFNATYCASDYNDILEDKNVDLIMICNRHGAHFEFVYRALQAGKNVFVEKPLCTTVEQLNMIESLFEGDLDKVPLLAVGYNRRFSPYAQKIKGIISKRVNPLFIQYRMNAGYAPIESWIHDDGGRIVGEACHIFDLMNFFTESKISSVTYDSLNPTTEKYFSADNKSIILRYDDGSICNIQYFAIGSTSLSKEYMEIHFDGKSIIMDDYKKMKFYGISEKEVSTNKSEKGHLEELHVIHKSLINNTMPIELWDLFQTTGISLLIK